MECLSIVFASVRDNVFVVESNCFLGINNLQYNTYVTYNPILSGIIDLLTGEI